MPETKIDDGGPAFPEVHTEDYHGDDCDCGKCPLVTESTPGMTLRDYFAAKAMEGILASEVDGHENWSPAFWKGGEVMTKKLARISYMAADAMLAERRTAE